MTGPHAFPGPRWREGPKCYDCRETRGCPGGGENHDRSGDGEWADRRERRGGREMVSRIVVGVVPYAMLGFAVALTPLLERGGERSVLTALGFSGLAAAWMLWMYTLHSAWRSRPRLMGLFIVVLLALMALLVLAYPWFGFFSFTGYFYLFTLVRSWRLRMAGAAVVSVLAGISQAGGPVPLTLVHVVILSGTIGVNAVVGCAFTWADSVRERQRRQRDRDAAEIAAANRRLAATLAENAGLHEQLLAQAREAGMLDERQRMAREIHDTLAQGLTGIITQLQAAQRCAQDPVERRRHFDAAVTLARESLTEARRSVRALCPEPLETARLSEALSAVARRWTERGGVPVQVAVTGTARPVRPEAESALLRIAQEALANVAKHAAATRVGVTLSYMDDEVVLDVRDDGRGFDLASVPPAADAVPERPGGFGLAVMRQRIEGQSGVFRVESEPGLGTAIFASVPVQPCGVGEAAEAEAAGAGVAEAEAAEVAGAGAAEAGAAEAGAARAEAVLVPAARVRG